MFSLVIYFVVLNFTTFLLVNLVVGSLPMPVNGRKDELCGGGGEVVQPGPARSGSDRATTLGATTSTSAVHDEDPEDDDEVGEDEEDVNARIPDEVF